MSSARVLLLGCSLLGALGVLVVLVSGCTQSPGTGVSPSPTESPLTCEQLLYPETVANFDSFGYEPAADFAEEAEASGDPTAAFVKYGGVLCQWGVPGTNNLQNYGFSPITEEQAASQKARLSETGLDAWSYEAGTLYSEPIESLLLNGEQFLFVDGYWMFGHDLARVDEILANAPRN